MIATTNNHHSNGASTAAAATHEFMGNGKLPVVVDDSQMPFFHGNISRDKTEK